MQRGIFAFFNTSRKVATTAVQTFVVDVAREGMIEFRPLHPVVRLLLMSGFGLMGIFLLSVFLGESIRGWSSPVVLVNDSSISRTYTIASVLIPLTFLALTVAWGTILCGALYAHPLFRWLILFLYFMFYAGPSTIYTFNAFVLGGTIGVIVFGTIFGVACLILLTFLLLPLIPFPRPLAWVWLMVLNTLITVSFYIGTVRMELVSDEAWLANLFSSLVFNHYFLVCGFLLISGLGWVTFALQTSQWTTDALQQHASPFMASFFLLLLLGLRGIAFSRLLAQGNLNGNAIIGACLLVAGLVLIGLFRRRLAAYGEIPSSFLIWFAVLLPLGQYLVFFLSQFGFAVIIAQLMRAETQQLLGEFSNWLVLLSDWDLLVRPLVLAGVGMIVAVVTQRRGNGTLATFGFVLTWTQLLAWFMAYGRPLAPYRFEYSDVDMVGTLALFILALMWVFTNQLTRERALHLFAIVALMALLNQTSFLDNPFSPLFGFAGIAFIVFGIFWNVIDLAGLFVNQDTPGLNRESRALLYIGYALLAVTVAHWFVASHQTIYQQTQSDITYTAFIALGYPLAFTVILEGGRSLVPSAPEPTPVEAISIEPMTS